MSHVVTIKIAMTSRDVLKTAFEKLGGIWVENVSTYKWWGRHEGDYPLPVGFSVKDMGTCHHKVQFPGATYEVGIIELDKLPENHPARTAVDKDDVRVYADGSFIPIFDFIDSTLTKALGGTNAAKLVQAYKMEKAKAVARKKGYTKFKETTDAKTGTVQLEIVTG